MKIKIVKGMTGIRTCNYLGRISNKSYFSYCHLDEKFKIVIYLILFSQQDLFSLKYRAS